MHLLVSIRRRRRNSLRRVGSLAAAVCAEELFEEEAGEESGIVADDAVFFEEIIGDEADFLLEDFLAINGNRFGVFRAVAAQDRRGDGFAVGDNSVNDVARDMELDGAKMVAEGVVSGFTGLRHQVGNVHAGGFGAEDGAGNLRNEEVRDDAGVKRTGTHEDKVGVLKRLNSHGERADATWVQLDLANGKLTAGDAGLAVDALAIGESRDQVNIRKSRGKNTAANREDLAGDADGFGKIASDMCESSKKEVTEVVTAEPSTGVEAILKKASKKSFVLGERHHAVADVAGREHAILAAQAAGAATIIGDGNDGDQVGDGALGRRQSIAAANDVFLQASEQSGETSAPAKCNYAQAGKCIFLQARNFHARLKY